MKRLLILVLLTLFITSCKCAKDDVPTQIIAEALGEKISDFEHMAELGKDYVSYCLGEDLSIFSEYIILSTFEGETYNEIGIFKVKSKEDISSATAMINNYLSIKKSTSKNVLSEEEYEKIKNPKITSYGKYVLYTILNGKEKDAVIKEFKNQLK